MHIPVNQVKELPFRLVINKKGQLVVQNEVILKVVGFKIKRLDSEYVVFPLLKLTGSKGY